MDKPANSTSVNSLDPNIYKNIDNLPFSSTHEQSMVDAYKLALQDFICKMPQLDFSKARYDSSRPNWCRVVVPGGSRMDWAFILQLDPWLTDITLSTWNDGGSVSIRFTDPLEIDKRVDLFIKAHNTVT